MFHRKSWVADSVEESSLSRDRQEQALIERRVGLYRNRVEQIKSRLDVDRPLAEQVTLFHRVTADDLDDGLLSAEGRDAPSTRVAGEKRHAARAIAEPAFV